MHKNSNNKILNTTLLKKFILPPKVVKAID